MSDETAESLRNLCRTCMTSIAHMKKYTRSTNHKQCISEKPLGSNENGPVIMELLQMVQPLIKVELEDDLPKVMCVGCIQQLQLTHEFLEMYKDSNKKFRKLLKEVYLQQEEDKYSKELNDNVEEVAAEQLEVLERGNTSDTNIAKFEIEIEHLGETMSMQRDALEIDEEYENPVNNWMEFEDELETNNEEYEEDNEHKTEVLDNPYSDASEDEWTHKEDTINVEPPAKESPNKNRRDTRQRCTKSKSSSSELKQKSGKALKSRKLPPMNDSGSIICQECDAVFDNIKLWREHMRDHVKVGRPRKSYKCEYCDKVLQNTAALKNHIRIHTGEEPFLCIECGKSFKVVSSLNTHMLRHKGEKNFQCPHCPKKFVCSSGLYGHMMVHKKEKPYVCDICGSAFHMAYMLKKHNLYHKDIRNYPCEYCDLRFVTGEKQRRHMRTHTGEKPYRCKYCDRAFAQSNDCNKHMKQHLGENIFQCELCPLRFPLVRELRVHFATHKDEDEQTRARNLAAREVEEKNLRLKLGLIRED